MVFTGTSVAAGAGQAVGIATGMQTEFGRIAGLLEEAAVDESTPLQKRLEAVGRLLVWASLGIVAIIFILGFLRSMLRLRKWRRAHCACWRLVIEK